MDWLFKIPPHAVAAFLYPFVLFILAVTVLTPCRKLVERYMTDGKLKRLLLRRVN